MEENFAYYTPINIANYCWDLIEKYIGRENISDIIEPSCGNGSFYHHDLFLPNYGFDIAPKMDDILSKYKTIVFDCDFLRYEIAYLPGRLIVGNPPFGYRMNTALQFYKKSLKICDYIAFILPISQLNNTSSLYEFDLVHSEDLGLELYSGHALHCCFNIYKRPDNGLLNKKIRNTLKDVDIFRQDQKNYYKNDYDIRICAWGANAGKIINNNEKYAAEYKIKIKNESKKEEIIDLLTNFDWNYYLKNISSKKIQKFHIIEVIKKNIKDIK